MKTAVKHEVIEAVSCIREGRWKYTLDKNFKVKLNRSNWKGKFVFYCDGRAWGCIEDDILTIYTGYSWDGCTVVPDTSRTLIASLLHDFLYQFGPCNIVWFREDADQIFFIQLTQDKFTFSRLYYFGVKKLGKTFYKTRPKPVYYEEIKNYDTSTSI